MFLPSLKTIGLTLLGLASFVAIMPLQMPSPAGDPSTQRYQAAEGSLIPAAEAYSDAAGFFKLAAVLAVMGVFLLAFSVAGNWHRDRQVRRKK